MMDRRQFLLSLGATAVVVPTREALFPSLAQAQPATIKDYAFAPGRTAFDNQAWWMLAYRPNTCAVALNSTPAISRLIDVIRDGSIAGEIDRCGPDTTRLAGDNVRQLIVVTHANNRGTINIALDPADYSVKGPDFATSMEDLDRVIGTHTIELPPLVTLDGVPITASNTAFRVLGCRIGAVKPFMEKLKQALGGVVPVIAPNHVHWIVWDHKEMRGGADCLQYDFEYTTLGKPTRKEVIDAFKAQAGAAFSAMSTPGNTTNVDIAYRTWKQLIGSPIPDSAWEDWIPPFPAPRLKHMPNTTLAKQPIVFKQAIVGLTHPPRIALAEFRCVADRAGPFHCPGGASIATAGAAARRDFVESCLAQDERFDAARTAYPYYARHRAQSMSEFMSAFQWWPRGFAPIELKKKMKQDPTQWWGHRRSYSILRPICDPDNSLIYNYVGEDGSWQNHLDRCLTDPLRASVKNLFFTVV